MNVYDFDDTIYDGDSSLDFLLFEGRRRLMAFIKACVKSVFPTMRYLCKLGTKENMKEHFFSVVRDVQDMDLEIKAFWDAHEHKFKTWYLDQQQPDDVVISASPLFLVKAGCDRIGIAHVIATEMDQNTGKITGYNCKGRNKPERFRELYPNETIHAFYSDSRSDQPMVDMAEQGYLVKGDVVEKWDAE